MISSINSDTVRNFLLFWDQCSTFADISDLDRAIEQFSLRASSEFAYRALCAEVLRLKGRPQEAVSYLNDLIDCDNALYSKEHPKVVARAFFCLGFLKRWLGEFDSAAVALVLSLEHDSDCQASLHALKYTKIDADLAFSLLDRLQAINFGNPINQSLAGFIKSEWCYIVGQTKQSLVTSYHSAKQSCLGLHRNSLDHSSVPTFPDAIIIGPPKCGTTSLAAWLSQHPDIYMHPSKEVHFFDNHWDRGSHWYKCQFPRFREAERRILRMEATPNYLQLPDVPTKIHQCMPGVKLIAILRHPVHRALSAFHHMQRQSGLTEPIEAILSNELSELSTIKDPELADYGWHRTNCLFGSFYSIYLNRWREYFGPDQLLVLTLESIVRNPCFAWTRLCEFLDVRSVNLPAQFPKQNTRPGAVEKVPQELLSQIHLALRREIDIWESCHLHN